MGNVPEYIATYRFILSFGLIIGGIAAIWFGYRLFAGGAGTARAIDNFNFESMDVKLSAAGMSVGAVLMLTSGVWCYFAYSSFPHLAMNGQKIEISDITLPNGVAANKVIGIPVFTSAKEKVGKISHVLMNDKQQVTGIVVQTGEGAGTKQIILGPKEFVFGKYGSGLKAAIKMNKQQLQKAPLVFRGKS